ncbi:hypothetical protein Tco_0091485 [Tanacetum coccineum]
MLPTNIIYLYVCPAVGSTCAYTMADMDIPANDAPAVQAPAVAPPTRMDDQIFLLSKWVPIGKSNCVLDVHKPQRNPIFPIVVALLKNTNFFWAFTTSSMILAIYIQHFWDTMCFNSSTGLYSCQLDEQWFNLHKDILIDALDITPANDNNPFMAPPSSDTVIEYVNTLGYPNTLRNVSTMSVNALYQPWRAILSMINMCLTGKTTGYDRPRHPVLQILWGIIHRSNIDYAERIWEEFVQSIQTFLTDRKNLATAARGKKKTAHLLILSVRFTKLIIHHLRTKHNIHPRTEHGKAEEGGATESSDATKVTKPKAAKVTKPAGDKAPKPTATQPPKPKPAPTQPSKAVSEKKRKLVKETPDEPSPAKRSKGGLVGKRRKLKSPLKLVGEPNDEERTQGPTRPVVLREPDSEKYQPLPEVQGKGKEKVIDEQVAHDLLTLQTPTEESTCDGIQYEEVHVINTGDQDKGQAGPNPGEQDEVQAGPNLGIQDEGQDDHKHLVMDGSVSTYPKIGAIARSLRARFGDLPPCMKEILQKTCVEEKKKHAAPRTPSGSPLSPHHLHPPPAGASSALGSAQQQGSKAPSSSKPAASTHQSMAWTTSDTRFESTGFMAAQELSPTDSLMQDDSIPDKQVHLSDDEDSGNDHLPKANLRQDWWKPLPEEERPATPEPAWTILLLIVADIEIKLGLNKTKLTQADFEGQAYEVVKAFYPDVIHLQFQMECHKMLIAQVDWTNPEGAQVRIDVNRPLPLDGPPGHVTIQPQFFFNKDLEYLRYGSKGSNPALSISKMKAASYPKFGLEQLVPEQIHDSPSRRKDVRTHMRILSVFRIKAYSRYGYGYLSEIVLRIADFQEHTIAERDFKNLYPSDFEDLNLLLLQGHLDHLPGSDKRMLSTAVKLWT